MSSCLVCGLPRDHRFHDVNVERLEMHAYVAPAPQPCTELCRYHGCGKERGDTVHGYGPGAHDFRLFAPPTPRQPIPPPAAPDAPVFPKGPPLVPYPADKPPRYNGSNEKCDMWVGPCCCGAWHHGDDDPPERRLRETEEQPAAPKLGVGDAERWSRIKADVIESNVTQADAEWLAQEVKRLRALTTPTLHTGTSPAEMVDALTSEVAGLRERLGEATGLLREVSGQYGIPIGRDERISAFLAAGAK